MVLQARVLVLATLLCVPMSLSAQGRAIDTKASDILSQTLGASGAGSVSGFTAVGTITYFWGGQEIQANARIEARGGDQFRMDADVPGGTRSVAFSRRAGSRKDAEGTVATIPAHNTLNAGILTFPYPTIATALTDAKQSLSYIGLVESGGRQFHQVRVSRVFSKDSDPDGLLAKLSATDYFIDATTLLVARTSDLTHPVQTMTESYPHDIELESYTTMNGVAVPTVVREKINGVPTWELHISGVNFSAALSDADFTLQ